MTSRGIDWTPGTHVRFGSLDFVITTKGDLVRVSHPLSPLPHWPQCDCRGSRGAAAERPRGPHPRARQTSRLRLQEVGALARHVPKAPSVLGGPVGFDLLLHQHRDTARRRRAALPRHLDPGRFVNVPSWFVQHHADCRAPYGATL
jgi:hypothetical protein